MIKMEDMFYIPNGVLARALRPRCMTPFVSVAASIFLVLARIIHPSRALLKFSLHPAVGPDKPTYNEPCDDMFIT
jgi:hypothetical protein